MKKPQAMMWYPEAWRSSIRVDAMEPACRAGYFDLLNALWLSGGALASAEQSLRAAARLPQELWTKHREEILANFEVSDSTITHHRITEEYERTTNLLKRRSLAGKAGAKQRHSKRKTNAKQSPAIELQTETETETETVKKKPPIPLFDLEGWWEDITRRYPKPTGVGAAYRGMSAQVGNLPEHRVADWCANVSRLVDILERCPEAKVKFLPNLENFLRANADDKPESWEATIRGYCEEVGEPYRAPSRKDPDEEQRTQEALRKLTGDAA